MFVGNFLFYILLCKVMGVLVDLVVFFEGIFVMLLGICLVKGGFNFEFVEVYVNEMLGLKM